MRFFRVILPLKVLVLFFFYVVIESYFLGNINYIQCSEVEYPPIEVVVEKPEVEEIPLEKITAYNAVTWQTQGDPNVSSCGPNIPNQIAVSRDLFFDENGHKHLCGTIVNVITDNGITFENMVIWDTMAPRFVLAADILMDRVDEAREFGVTSGVLQITN